MKYTIIVFLSTLDIARIIFIILTSSQVLRNGYSALLSLQAQRFLSKLVRSPLRLSPKLQYSRYSLLLSVAQTTEQAIHDLKSLRICEREIYNYNAGVLRQFTIIKTEKTDKSVMTGEGGGGRKMLE